MIVKAQGHKFKFYLNNIGRGMWVVELHEVDDQIVNGGYSDPYPNEREARKGAQAFAEVAYRDEKYGWCARPTNPPRNG
jgi:hypothetical protein